MVFEMRKKGFTFALSIFSFIITIVVAVIIIFSMFFMTTFHIYITKTFIIERVLESTQVQDALLSLLESEQEGVKFRQALIYSFYENSEKPKIWNGEKIVEFELSEVAKNFLEYVYESDKYWLFIYNESSNEIKTLATNEKTPEETFKKNNKKDRRASFPIYEKTWLVLYVRLSATE